jgi:hypothetical protein
MHDLARAVTLTVFAPGVANCGIRASLKHPHVTARAGHGADHSVGRRRRRLLCRPHLVRSDPRIFRRPRLRRAGARPRVRRRVSTGPPTIRLDQDLVPTTFACVLTGIPELLAINRFVGFLINRDRPPDRALRELGHQATAAGVTLLVVANHLLGHDLTNNRPNETECQPLAIRTPPPAMRVTVRRRTATVAARAAGVVRPGAASIRSPGPDPPTEYRQINRKRQHLSSTRHKRESKINFMDQVSRLRLRPRSTTSACDRKSCTRTCRCSHFYPRAARLGFRSPDRRNPPETSSQT